MPANSKLDPVAVISGSHFQECCLEIKFLFVDRSWTTDTVGIQTTLELDKRPNVFAVVNIDIEQVALVEIAVHERLLAPIVVSDLFPNFAGFASDGHKPIVPTLPQPNVFAGIPKFLPLRRIGKKTPVIILAKQVVDPGRHRGFSG